MSSLLEAIRVVHDPRPERPPIRESDARDALDPVEVSSRISAMSSQIANRDGIAAAPLAVAAYRAEYRHLYELYQETLGRLKAEAFSGGYWPDETPEL